MKQINMGTIVMAILIISIVLSSCGSQQETGLILTPLPTNTFEATIPPSLTPAATSTQSPSPVPDASQITTSLGNIVITKAEVASEDPFGDKAAPGYQIINIYFKSADGSEIDGSAFYNESQNVSVIGDDGSETKSYTGGLLAGQLFAGFTPPDTAHSFKLVWPGNDPVELVISK